MAESNSNLRVCSFNCQNIKSSLEEVKQLCCVNDIVLLQETWLFSHELNYILSISPDHYGKAITSMNSEKGVIKGRPYGGLAILWHKDIADMCKIVD